MSTSSCSLYLRRLFHHPCPSRAALTGNSNGLLVWAGIHFNKQREDLRASLGLRERGRRAMQFDEEREEFVGVRFGEEWWVGSNGRNSVIVGDGPEVMDGMRCADFGLRYQKGEKRMKLRRLRSLGISNLEEVVTVGVRSLWEMNRRSWMGWDVQTSGLGITKGNWGGFNFLGFRTERRWWWEGFLFLWGILGKKKNREWVELGENWRD